MLQMLNGHVDLIEFRIVFPTVAQNTSPVTILANFIEVLGRKMDSCEDILDRPCPFPCPMHT